MGNGRILEYRGSAWAADYRISREGKGVGENCRHPGRDDSGQVSSKKESVMCLSNFLVYIDNNELY